MGAMVDMSRAIRHVLEDHSATRDGTLATIPTETLGEFTTIVGAFASDLREELERRRRAEINKLNRANALTPQHLKTDAQLRAAVNLFTQDDPPPYKP